MESMKNEFKDITNFNKRAIYKLWKNYHFKDNEIIPVGNKDKSYGFAVNGKDILPLISENLADYFSIEDKNLFYNKFRMSCSGNGGEELKITTLHSSSLCALLFFYNVCEDNPLEIDKIPGYEFVDSVFEFKNKVIGYPSNIDIVLLGRKKSKRDEKIILFLESKFSEYITGITTKNSKYEIGKSYFSNDYSKPFYKEEFLKTLQLKRYEENSKTYLKPLDEVKENGKYIEGIKQMISHYVGIRNFINGKYFYNSSEEILERVKKYRGGEIILGEILFDKFEDELTSKYLKPYEKDYKEVAKTINKEAKRGNCEQFRILETPLHYSDLKDLIKDEKIKEYYFKELRQKQ